MKYELNNIYNEDSLEYLKTKQDYEFDMNYSDPPYALGSEVIGGIKAGFTNWCGCEINPEYIEIAKARIQYWTENKFESQENLFDILNEKEAEKQEQVNLFKEEIC